MAPFPDNENARLEALRSCHLLDTKTESAYDDLTRLASYLCGTPIATITLIDAERQWFKSIQGLAIVETPREHSFCAHAILQFDLMVVPDATLDKRFADNPLVTGEPHIRFYAGTPLITSEGLAIGALCVIDRIPRQLTLGQEEALLMLARQASSQLELTRRIAMQEGLAAKGASAESERRRLAAIVESSADSIISNDLDGKILSWNAGAERLYGYSAAEMIGKSQSSLVPEGETGFLSDLLPTLIDQGRMENLEVVRRRKDGARIDLSLTLSLIRDSTGQPVGTSAVARDITERKRVEEALNGERRFRDAVLDTLDEGIVVCDGMGILSLFNRATREFHGLPEKMLPLEEWAKHFDLFHADGLTPMEISEIPLYHAFQGELVREAEMVIAPHSGPPRSLLATGQAIYDGRGEKIGAVVAMHDITERKQMERELKRLAAIVESSDEGIIAETLDGTIVAWNSGATRIYGYSEADMIGQHFSVLALPAEKKYFPEVIAALQRGEALQPTEVIRSRKNGARIHISLSFSPIRDDAGQMVGVSCISRDITEKKWVEAELEESEARLRRLSDAAFEGIAVTQNGVFIDANKAFAAMQGYQTVEDIIGKEIELIIDAESLPLILEKIAANDQNPYEATLQRRDGTSYIAEIRGHCSEWGGKPARITAIRDITERKQIEDKLKDVSLVLERQKQELESANAELAMLAFLDGLTGLRNRRAFDERFAEEFERAARYHAPLSLLLLDIDNFKEYNDAYGHLAGDDALRQIARVLQTLTRETDMTARYGGEEIALILPETNSDGAMQTAERLRVAIESASWDYRTVTVSIGVCTLNMGMGLREEMVAEADRALYHSKSIGKNRATHAAEISPNTLPSFLGSSTAFKLM